MNEDFIDDLWARIESTFSHIEQELRRVNPRLRWTAGRWSPGEIYPLSAYASASLAHPAENIEDVDLSVQLKWDGAQLLASSDICLSDGQYIAEGPVVREPSGANREQWAHAQIDNALEFLVSHLDALRDLVRME